MKQFIIAVSIALADQLSKLLVLKYLAPLGEVEVVGRFLRFHYLENRGAAFGILQGKTFFFLLVTALAFFLIIRYLRKEGGKDPLVDSCLACIAGGAAGNLIDRLLRGYVVDFILLDLVDFYSFPIFNLADIFVTLGCFILLIHLLLQEDKEGEGKEEKDGGKDWK